MHRLSADRTGRPHIDRGMSYRNSGIPKPSQVDAGSGATPTIPPAAWSRSPTTPTRWTPVVYRTATRLCQHQHRSSARCRRSPRAQTPRRTHDRLRPLTERREQLRLPGPVRPPHRCDHTARLRADGHQQTHQRLRAGVDKPHRERPQHGYQSSPRQPRLDRALGASASGAKQSRHRRRDASQAWPLPDTTSHRTTLVIPVRKSESESRLARRRAPPIRQKGNRGHRLWTRAPCICTTGLGQRVRAVRRAYGLREKRAPETRRCRSDETRTADERDPLEASVRRGLA